MKGTSNSSSLNFLAPARAPGTVLVNTSLEFLQWSLTTSDNCGNREVKRRAGERALRGEPLGTQLDSVGPEPSAECSRVIIKLKRNCSYRQVTHVVFCLFIAFRGRLGSGAVSSFLASSSSRPRQVGPNQHHSSVGGGRQSESRACGICVPGMWTLRRDA